MVMAFLTNFIVCQVFVKLPPTAYIIFYCAQEGVEGVVMGLKTFSLVVCYSLSKKEETIVVWTVEVEEFLKWHDWYLLSRIKNEISLSWAVPCPSIN